MSTGGLALLIYAQPHQFPGLRQTGFVVYITNLVIFAGIVAAMTMRFVLHKGTFKTSITHSREAFFVPTAFLALATIITGTQRYAIPEATTSAVWFISVLFWGYVAASLFVAIAQYSYVFRTHQLGLQTMMPTWILPIFPIMLSGTIASVIAETQPQMNAIPIIVVGLTCQGLGLSVAFMMYAHMVGRLMSRGKLDISVHLRDYKLKHFRHAKPRTPSRFIHERWPTGIYSPGNYRHGKWST